MRKWYALTIVLVTALDRLVKAWTLNVLKAQPQGTIPLWEDVFHLTYVENRGAAFGMMQGQQIFFYAITAVVTLVLLWYLFVRPIQSKVMGIALSLLLGGALGNCFDRAVYGFVVDLFDFRLIHFAVFNVADSAICIGVFLFALTVIVQDVRQSRQRRAETEKA